MSRTFLFAGGGTGGHIYPALAIAQELAALAPDARFRFAVSRRPIDALILSRETLMGKPVEFETLPAQAFGVRPRVLYRFLTNWGAAVRAGRVMIREGPAPVTVVAMGGFVAAPVVQAARVQKCPVVLVNLDAVPGKANRWVAKHAGAILTAAPLAPGHEHPTWTQIPPIVRTQARTTKTPAECREAFGLAPNSPTLLVTGGSQGAGTINQLLEGLARAGSSPLRGWQVIHQTGTPRSSGDDESARLREAYQAAGVKAWVNEFITNMGEAWGAADLAISRAGAGSVAEAWCARVPSVFLPYPYHRDQHQKHNARVLAEAGGALVVTDHIDAATNQFDAGGTIAELLRMPERRDAMRAALERLGPADGAAQVAEVLASDADT